MNEQEKQQDHKASEEELREGLKKLRDALDKLQHAAAEAQDGDKQQDSTDGDDKKDKEENKKLTPGKIAAIAAVTLVLVVATVYFLYERHKYESTDDAYVRAYSTQLAPKVSAIVTQVLVEENQKVRAGQILAQLDRKDYEAALADAAATLGAIQAQSANAERDFHRSESLVKNRVISQQQFDANRANYLNLERQAKAAAARVDQARLDLEYTSVRAPTDGQIALRSVDVGMYVSAGTAIFGFVPSDTRWVDANFKETQLEYADPGRPAEITLDSIPGKKFAGVVESRSPATGATFTLMPPDNATGNFTKVVQRVPVRIRLKNITPEDIDKIQAGLSANVNLVKHAALENLPPPPKPVFATEEIDTPSPPLSGNL